MRTGKHIKVKDCNAIDAGVRGKTFFVLEETRSGYYVNIKSTAEREDLPVMFSFDIQKKSNYTFKRGKSKNIKTYIPDDHVHSVVMIIKTDSGYEERPVI
jgi:hypothetical protein